MNSLKNKVALITGCRKDIAVPIIKAYLAMGVLVVVTEGLLTDTEPDENIFCLSTVSNSTLSLTAAVIDKFGRMDIAINTDMLTCPWH